MEKEKRLWGGKSRLVKNRSVEDELFTSVDVPMGTNVNFDENLERIETLISNLSDQYNDLAEKLDRLDSFTKPEERSEVEVGNGKLEHLDSLLGGLSSKFDGFDERLQKMEPLLELVGKNGTEVYNEKLEHLDSLTRLAESTIVEADKLSERIGMEVDGMAHARANEIIAEAEERAKEEANRIIYNAEERSQEKVLSAEQQAQNILRAAEERVEQIKASANEEAQKILRQANENAEEEAKIIRQEAKELLIRSKHLAEGELKGMFDQVYQKLLANLHDVEQTANNIISEKCETAEPVEFEGAVFEQEEPTAEEPPEQPMVGQAEESEFEPQVAIEKREEPIVEGLPEQPMVGQAEESEFEPEISTHEQEELPIERESLEQPPNEQEELVVIDPELFDGTVELAIPPPVPLDRMLQFHKSLKQIPHIEVLNLGGSVDKGITIRVLVEPSTPLLKVVKELPEVSEVIEELPNSENVVPRRQGEDNPIRRILVTTKE